MKKALLLLLYSLAAVTLYGQGFVVAHGRLNTAYIGVENPLSVAVEHCSCKDISLTTDNGILTSDAPCHYIWKPGKTGRAQLTLDRQTVSGLKNIGNLLYRVKPLPVPKVIVRRHFYAKEGQAALLLHCDDFDFEAPFTVLDFKIELLRKGELIYNAINKGAALDAITRENIGKLYPQDIVRITNIHYKGPDNITQTIDFGIHQTIESINAFQW